MIQHHLARDALPPTQNFVTTTIIAFRNQDSSAKDAEGIGLKVGPLGMSLWVVGVARVVDPGLPRLVRVLIRVHNQT